MRRNLMKRGRGGDEGNDFSFLCFLFFLFLREEGREERNIRQIWYSLTFSQGVCIYIYI